MTINIPGDFNNGSISYGEGETSPQHNEEQLEQLPLLAREVITDLFIAGRSKRKFEEARVEAEAKIKALLDAESHKIYQQCKNVANRAVEFERQAARTAVVEARQEELELMRDYLLVGNELYAADQIGVRMAELKREGKIA